MKKAYLSSRALISKRARRSQDSSVAFMIFRKIQIASLALAMTIIGILFSASPAFARENVNYWYVKNFDTDITVNKDSSLDIVESITADCGIAEKHGIFRVLPTVQYLEGKNQKSPIKLKSITDFSDKKYNYSTSYDPFDHTVTWKIGDEDIFVTGVNEYKISYSVKNAVRNNSDFDELYWNLSGNFWDIPIDNFKATIHLPDGVNKNNLQTSIYSGSFGDKNSLRATYEFIADDTIQVAYSRTLAEGEGITISAVFPTGIVTPYVPGFWEKNGAYFFYLFPILIFWMCLKLWQKYGRDPKVNPTVAPEFEIPEKLSPIEMGLVYTDGSLRNSFISASIINLAVNGFIKIKQIQEKGFLRTADFELEKIKQSSPSSVAEATLLNKLFSSKDKIKLSSLKNTFYVHLTEIGSSAKNFLHKKKFLVPNSKTFFFVFLAIGIIGFFSSFVLFVLSVHLFLSALLSSITILIFSPLMQKRTEEGHVLFRRIQGFKLYMDKAERYRQRYLEKENLFEKLLPYAIMFGITEGWINKMKDIYGEKYFASYHPVWFYGVALASFNANSFSSAISQVSSNMASTMSSSPSSSGVGGGGFSGGGGGGGGGGGW